MRTTKNPDLGYNTQVPNLSSNPILDEDIFGKFSALTKSFILLFR